MRLTPGDRRPPDPSEALVGPSHMASFWQRGYGRLGRPWRG